MAPPWPTGTHRYGFTNRLTGEAHGELELDQQSLAAVVPTCSASTAWSAAASAPAAAMAGPVSW